MPFEEDVLRLAQQGMAESEIAEQLRAKRATVHRILREVGRTEPEDSEGDDEPQEDTDIKEVTAELVVPTSTRIASRVSPLPILPQPRADQRDRLRQILRYFEDNATGMRWRDPWDLVTWLWDQAGRVPQLEADLAASRAQLAQAQGQLEAWERWKDDRVGNEVERKATERRHQLDETYSSQLSNLRATLDRETAARVAQMAELGQLRERLRLTIGALQRSQAERDQFADENQSLRVGLDRALRGWVEREGLSPDARGLNALLGRLGSLYYEQFRENLTARYEGRDPRPAQLGGGGQ